MIEISRTLWTKRFVLSLVLLGGLVALPASAQTSTRGDNEGLKLFEKMLPVFMHPRCLNCHGGTNPVTGENHPDPGGAIGGIVMGPSGFIVQKTGGPANLICKECHTAGGEQVRWELAPMVDWFVGKDSASLCRHIRESSKTADRRLFPESFLDHVRTDDRIQLGFEGLRGIDEKSPLGARSPRPPDMSFKEFTDHADRWATEGKMGCGPSWSGTITWTRVIKGIGFSENDKIVLELDGTRFATYTASTFSHSDTANDQGKRLIAHDEGQTRGTIEVYVAFDNINRLWNVGVPSIDFEVPWSSQQEGRSLSGTDYPVSLGGDGAEDRSPADAKRLKGRYSYGDPGVGPANGVTVIEYDLID